MSLAGIMCLSDIVFHLASVPVHVDTLWLSVLTLDHLLASYRYALEVHALELGVMLSLIVTAQDEMEILVVDRINYFLRCFH